jgi:hypothetical protein
MQTKLVVENRLRVSELRSTAQDPARPWVVSFWFPRRSAAIPIEQEGATHYSARLVNAAWRIPPWLVSGPGCRDRRLSRGLGRPHRACGSQLKAPSVVPVPSRVAQGGALAALLTVSEALERV